MRGPDAAAGRCSGRDDPAYSGAAGETARAAEQIDRGKARQEADQSCDDDKPQVMFGDKTIEYSKHGSTRLFDKDCLEIARNHLFTVNFWNSRISGRDGIARARAKYRRDMSISGHEPERRWSRAFFVDSPPGV